MRIEIDLHGLRLIQADWPDCPANVRAYATTRSGGVSLGRYGNLHGSFGLNLGDHVGDQLQYVMTNRVRVEEALSIPVMFLSQIHGTIAIDANLLDSTRGATQADASYVATPNRVCAVLTADCLPLLITSLCGRYVAAVHAGWRGLAEGVIEETIGKLRAQGATEFSVWLGPAIGPQRFEVGQDVVDVFTTISPLSNQNFVETSVAGKYLANIYGLARDRLSNLGIRRVHGGEYCTVTDEDLFYSYRRDGVTGRMASLIWFVD